MTRFAPTTSRAWLCVALLWFVAFLNYLDRVMLTTMRGSVVDAIPMTDAQFGLLTSAFLWVCGATSPFAGFLADRFGRSRVIIVSLFAWSSFTWLTGHAKTFEQLLLARSFLGVSEACYIPAGMALIMDYHRGTTRSLANGIHVSGVMVGSGLGGIGGLLAEKHPWGFPFKLFGAIGVVYSLLLILFLRDPTPTKSSTEPAEAAPNLVPALRSLFSQGAFYLAILYWALLGVVGWGINGWMPTYFGERFQLRQGAAGLSAMGFMQAGSMIGVILGGALTDRWSRKGERKRITITSLALCVAAPALLLTANTHLLALAIAGLVLYGLVRSFADANMMPILCLVADPRYRATGYGILNMFAFFVGGITIYAGGALRDANIDVNRVFQLSALFLLVAAGVLSLVKQTKASGTNPADNS